MAKLDPAIFRLLDSRATDLYLQTNAVPTLRTHNGAVPLLKQALSTAQIVGAIAELCPAARRAGFPAEGDTVFTYPSPTGVVKVAFQKREERVTVVITRAVEEVVPPESLFEPPGTPFTTPEGADGPCMPIPIRGLAAKLPPLPAANDPMLGPDEPLAPPPPRVESGPPVLNFSGDALRAMESLLNTMVAKKASDLHLSSDTSPMLRVDGDIASLNGHAALPPARLRELLFSIAPQKNRDEFDRTKDTDFSYQCGDARFRVNLFADRKGVGGVIRQIPTKIPTAADLALPPALLDLCMLHKGLVLVTGPTGSGKSTTLAAMVDHINRERQDHIITIEDPIEFVHPNRRCLVNQREIGTHTQGFKHALRAALREDPDVVLVGELRDLETISIAIETAETGHLVFGTLHTNTAPSTVDRVIDQFPADRQAQVRTMLSESLKGVVSQTLCKKIGGGRVAAQEILIATPSVSNLIREGKTFQLPSVLQTGRAIGMNTMNDALLDLVKRNLIEPQEAMKKSVQRSELKAALERSGFKLDGGAEKSTAQAA